LGERLLCKQEAIGSIPFTSTIQEAEAGKYEHHESPIGCASRSIQPSSFDERRELKAVLFFNNSEGKGSSGLDESLGGHRVELYLAHNL
jgi:hypothetical protein